ncbi:MAG: MFS transporter [Flavobacteriales bacterium]|nr:MFS transporter [Flavobacteriales bacterium]
MPNFQKGSKRARRGWAFYDWANSVYSLVIATAVFPIYYGAVTTGENDNLVRFLGIEWENTVIYSYCLSFSFLVVALLSPLLSGIADYSGAKKRFLQVFCYVGALACGGLYFFNGENVALALVLTIVASVGFWGSLVFYNAYLPEVAFEEQQDATSAMGFSFGYFGATLLLVFNLAMILQPEVFGLQDSGQASRISFLMVAVWWIGFAQVTFRRLPDRTKPGRLTRTILGNGYKALREVWNQLAAMPDVKRFLTAFFLLSVGVQTIIYVASLFGEKELNLDSTYLIGSIILIQILGIVGAQLFSHLSARFGNIKALMVSLVVWASMGGVAFALRADDPLVEYKFLALGSAVGLVLGGVQALARSTYSKMLPQDSSKHTSFFSFYDVTEKVAIILGTFIYGLLESITGNMRTSVVALSLFFVLSILVLLPIRKRFKPYLSKV